MTPRSFIRLITLSILVMGLISCRGTVPDEKPSVVSVSVTPSSIEIMEGESCSLKAEISPASASSERVIWASADATVASVDQTGRVVGLCAGRTTVSATAGDKTGRCSVVVSAAVIPVTSISLNTNELSLYTGEKFQFQATVLPENATDKGLKWSSNDLSVCSVSDHGLVEAIGVGQCTINVESIASGVVSACLVSVSEKEDEGLFEGTSPGFDDSDWK